MAKNNAKADAEARTEGKDVAGKAADKERKSAKGKAVDAKKGAGSKPQGEGKGTARKGASQEKKSEGNGKIAQLRDFFEESKAELKKVTWPSRKETIATSIAVIVLTIVMSVYLGIVDLGLSKIVEFILS